MAEDERTGLSCPVRQAALARQCRKRCADFASVVTSNVCLDPNGVWHAFLAADEIFSSGNFAKVAPMTRIEDREIGAGPVSRRARALYWDFAHAG